MLHVTNGDGAGEKLRRSGVPGQVLPWRDVLHEGPVPAGLAPDELRRVRARFLADQGWGKYEEVVAGFAERDAHLAGLGDHEEVVLWFEHDLYDQLQLLQILDLLAGRPEVAERSSLICIDSFPGVDRFIGLGQLQPGELAELFAGRVPLTPEQLDLGRRAWAAFRSPDPTAIERLLSLVPRALPFLGAALRRHLEQFPSTHDGLSRTAHEILEAVLSGVRQPARIFRAVQDMEAAPFLGDTVFWLYLSDLCSGPRPLLRPGKGDALGPPADRASWEREIVHTENGEAVREGRADWPALCGGLDRWLGGVHLTGLQPQWRWDREAERLTGALTSGASPPGLEPTV